MVALRGGVAAALALNLALGWFVIHPPGGSFSDLSERIAAARRQTTLSEQNVANLRRALKRGLAARGDGEDFLKEYFLPRRYAYSQLEIDLAAAAQAAQIKARERSFSYEAIEGSDTLGMVTVLANYEGSYAQLIRLMGEMDRARRLVIVESLQAQPQQGGATLAISMRLNAFFRTEGPQDGLDFKPLAPRSAPLPAAKPASVLAAVAMPDVGRRAVRPVPAHSEAFKARHGGAR
jgi:hypothetical protein